MKKNTLISILGFFIVLTGFILFQNDLKTTFLNHSDLEEMEYGPEEKPDLIISPEEQAINKRHQERFLSLKTNLKSASVKSTMADGQLSGTWNQFKFLTSSLYQGHLGFRVDGSMYDKENDVIYAISYAGHLYRINRTDGDVNKTDWELLDHNNNYLTHAYAWNNWVRKFYRGLNKADGSFRMIRATQSGMEYSDNEGRDWTKVANLAAIESASEGAIVKTATGSRVFVIIKKSSTNHQVFVSDNDGETYNSLSTTFNPNTYSLTMFKAHNSESVFIAAYNKSTAKMSIYEHTVDGDGFELINTSVGTILEPNAYSHISATLVDGTYHIYIGSTNKDFYYSTDKGATWSHTSVTPEAGYGHYNLREVHPAKPNLVHRGFLDIMLSKNYGKTWEGTQHHIGWDVQHSNYYQRKDGSYFLFIGNDMGCFINDDPEDKEQYIDFNNGSPSQMCYDVDHGQHTYTSFSAMQDRGVTGYNTESKMSESHFMQGGDGLRSRLSYNETSVWIWTHYGSINRRENFLFGSAPAVGVGGKGDWWAVNMVASPNPKEDAMILAYGNKLNKLTYNPAYNKVIETQHHFDFNKISGSKITGFAYSSVNKNLWYVSLENRNFYYSVDGGQTFEESSYTGIRPWSEGNWHKLQHVIKASKKDEKTVYWAGKGNTFLISKDGGKTFTNHNSGLDVARIIDFDMTPDEKFIFAACWGAGAWIYSADTDRWYPIVDAAIPSTEINFTDAEFIDKKNEIRFGTFGSGILSFTIDGQDLEINYPDMLSAELNDERNVVLTWEDKSNNEDGFTIERATNGVFSELARVNANQTSYTDSDQTKEGQYIYRVKAYNTTDESYFSNYAFEQIKANSEVDKSGWTLVSVDNEADGYAAEQAFDGNSSTIWHTQWGVSPLPGYPHTIVIDMNETIAIKGFGYLPRQDEHWNGMFKDFEFYVSTDNENWTKVASGSWEKTLLSKVESFDEPITARYLKLVGLSEINGGGLGSCAEISVYTELTSITVPNAPIVIQAGRTNDTEISLTWVDLSMNEDGYIVEQYIDGAYTPVFTSGEDVTTFTLSNADVNTTYKFRVSAYNNIGNSEYSDVLIYAKGAVVGIDDKALAAKELLVYPNPFTNKLKVSSENKEQYSGWQIIDISGKVVKQGTFQDYSGVEEIQVQDLKPGTYILRAEGKDGSASKTIIKK